MSDAVENLKAAVEADNTDTSDNATETASETPQATQTPDEWYSSLDDDTKALAESYAQAQAEKLSSALKEERANRKALEKQVRELSQKAGKDNELSTQLQELSSNLTEANRKAAFYEAAGERDDLPRHRVAAAYKIAKLDNLIDDDNNVDWDAMKASHDYLFVEVSKKVAGNAGNGTGTKPQPKVSMNDMMRRSVGR
jgi:protein-arginine kinase activator protein McsA